jgi:hypothetical protein
MTKVYSAAKAREEFADILNMVGFMGIPVVIERYGEPLVKILPADIKKKNYEELVEKYFGIWEGKKWAKDIGKSSRYFRKRSVL